jgi:N-acetylneuraminic acid mutarotase
VRALLLGASTGRTRTSNPTVTSPIQSRSPGYLLPAPVQRAVAVGSRSGIVIAGGLDAGGASTNGVFRLDPSSGHFTRLGTVPEPFHDAAAGLIGTRLFVFGGGSSHSSSSVQSFDLATRKGSVAAHLPRPLSDVAAATIGGTIYLVGGYDDHNPRAEIYATTDGTHFRLVGWLPHGLRYPAVAASGGRLVVAGGNLASGAPSAAIYGFDPGSGQVRVLGQLATATAHASAVTLGGSVYIVGGVDAAGQTIPSATRVDSPAQKVSPLALNVPLADAAVAQVGSQVFLLGGRRNGRAVADVFVLR